VTAGDIPMWKKGRIWSVISVVFVTALVSAAIYGQEKKTLFHPSFEYLLKTYPRKAAIVNPMVPRIHAKSAYQLYVAGKAIFLYAGSSTSVAGGALIPGAIAMDEKNGFCDNPPMELLNKFKDKMFIIYCHCDGEQYGSGCSLRWMDKGIRNVVNVYGGEYAMRGAGFPFPKAIGK
jgi:hypothetical protein